jgi:hypothetical protein
MIYPGMIRDIDALKTSQFGESARHNYHSMGFMNMIELDKEIQVTVARDKAGYRTVGVMSDD